jgi:hypothetical protein
MTAEVRGKGTYHVTMAGGEVREERMEPRVLPGSA